ncbi:hypothetical protein NE852_32160 (plasmid) [Rhizobium sp. Pop5]|uniref:hypothetical protein n=1 Tax=Rhizobium sp. Pop5 TaxID=1223565 RepID=UPI000AF3CD36|nr:hypothetical protein [Rhizobium sp. Pop5]UVD60394.1 hypothetical protein NE852_32160 [Rhizobium sp. Pop5]
MQRLIAIAENSAMAFALSFTKAHLTDEIQRAYPGRPADATRDHGFENVILGFAVMP